VGTSAWINMSEGEKFLLLPEIELWFSSPEPVYIFIGARGSVVD
jgi:hypothetical protein